MSTKCGLDSPCTDKFLGMGRVVRVAKNTAGKLSKTFDVTNCLTFWLHFLVVPTHNATVNDINYVMGHVLVWQVLKK
eukprot:6474032-Amphidinium_carterae.2